MNEDLSKITPEVAMELLCNPRIRMTNRERKQCWCRRRHYMPSEIPIVRTTEKGEKPEYAAQQPLTADGPPQWKKRLQNRTMWQLLRAYARTQRCLQTYRNLERLQLSRIWTGIDGVQQPASEKETEEAKFISAKINFYSIVLAAIREIIENRNQHARNSRSAPATAAQA